MKKAFDAVAWMRHRRVQIDEEDAGLTWIEKRRKTREQVLQDPVLSQLGGETVAHGRRRRTKASRP